MRFAYRIGRIVGTIRDLDVRMKIAAAGLIVALAVAIAPPRMVVDRNPFLGRSGVYRQVDVRSLILIWGAIAGACLIAMYGSTFFSKFKTEKLEELDRVYLPSESPIDEEGGPQPSAVPIPSDQTSNTDESSVPMDDSVNETVETRHGTTSVANEAPSPSEVTQRRATLVDMLTLALVLLCAWRANTVQYISSTGETRGWPLPHSGFGVEIFEWRAAAWLNLAIAMMLAAGTFAFTRPRLRQANTRARWIILGVGGSAVLFALFSTLTINPRQQAVYSLGLVNLVLCTAFAMTLSVVFTRIKSLLERS